MTPTVRSLRLIGLGALVLAVGCASTTTRTVPEPPPQAAEKQDPGPVTIRQAGAEALTPVYFDTDLALLREDTRRALDGHAQAILAHPEWGVLTIEGHCDERGSDEYNVALGGRRAAAVKRYLVDSGVPAARLDTRTFGEAQPAVAGHDESAWRYNRRSELKDATQRSAAR